MKRIIDMATYPRREHFDYFRSLAFPYVGLTANVDVTNLLRFAKERGGSGFQAIVWAAAQAVDAVPELRQRIQNDQIVEFSHSNISYTVAKEDHTFCNCQVDTQMLLEAFFAEAKVRQEEAKQKSGFQNSAEVDVATIFASCVPWVSFTQVVQPVPSPGDCNPRIVFGKYITQGSQIWMPLHIQCNHALVDGYHVGEFFRVFQEINDGLV